MNQEPAITQLLSAWSDGDEDALEALTPLVYQELHRLARNYMRQENQRHVLQTTALVNEAFLRLVGSSVEIRDRQHFFALAARLMRRVLVDFARRRVADKRGGPEPAVTLDEERMAAVGGTSVLALHGALERLEALAPRQARIVELKYFGGLTGEEIASLVDISTATVERDLRAARAWLQRELGT